MAQQKDSNNASYWADVLENTVQTAIDKGDFSNLTASISKSVDGLSKSISPELAAAHPGYGDGTTVRYASQKNSGKEASSAPATPAPRPALPAELFESFENTRRGAFPMALAGFLCGIAFALICIISLVIGLISRAITGGSSAAAPFVFLAISVVFFIIGIIGALKLSRAGRYERYCANIDSSGVTPVSKLAAVIGRQESYVIGDLGKMISAGWFKKGRISPDKANLLTSDDAYRQDLKRSIEDADKARQAAEKADRLNNMSAQAKQIMADVQRFLDEIRAASDRISDESMKAKLTQMDTILTKLLNRAKERPDKATELQKAANYYLPTTVKLLNTYTELDANNDPKLEISNVVNSRKEISSSIDTLNNAYIRMLDDMFRDTAWDVSTDISVMKTLLAQDGISDPDFNMDAQNNAAVKTPFTKKTTEEPAQKT